MTEAKTPKASKNILNDRVKALSTKFQETTKVDPNTGATEMANIFNENLPAGHTAETVKELKDYEKDYIAGGAHAFGICSLAAMAANAELKTTTTTLPMFGKDETALAFHRAKPFTVKTNGEEKSGESLGKMDVTARFHAGTNTGQISTARKELAALAAEQFKS